MLTDGWNRLTLLVTLVVTGSAVPARSSVPTKVTVSGGGSGAVACTGRVTKMVRLAPGARGVEKLKLLLIDVTGATGVCNVWLTTMLPNKVSLTLWMKSGMLPVFWTVSG